MERIRILLTNAPRMTRELLRNMIEGQEDMELVGEVVDPLKVLLAVRETAADAVMLGLEDSEEPGVCSHLLAEYPNLTILALTADGKTAFLRPGRREIAEPSEAEILNALRQAMRGKGYREERYAGEVLS